MRQQAAFRVGASRVRQSSARTGSWVGRLAYPAGQSAYPFGCGSWARPVTVFGAAWIGPVALFRYWRGLLP